MITLYGFGASFSMIDASPFVVKVDVFLRMAKLPYEFNGNFNNLKKSPKGKLPFIEDNNTKIGDSSFIVEYLTNKYNVELDSFLTDEEKAIGYLITKSLDENLYWCLVYSRWIDDQSWPLVKETFFGQLPFPVKLFVPALIRKSVKKNLNGQGIGRHSKQEVLIIAEQSFSALSVMLGDKPYFFGDKPCSFDAVAFSALSGFISVDFDNDFNNLARKYENLVRYCQNIQKTFYSSSL